MEYIKNRERIRSDAFNLTVHDQYELARMLANNCGYKLVAEDSERSIMIKTILIRMKENGPAVKDEEDREIIIAGLEGLLKC